MLGKKLRLLKQAPTSNVLAVFCVIFAAIFLAAPSFLMAQAFPLYDVKTSYSDDPTTETWVLYPFYLDRETSQTLSVALHPLFSSQKDKSTLRSDFDFLWPIFSHRYRPDKIGAKNYSSNSLFPLYFDRKETRFNQENSVRLLLPIYFQGKQGKRGRYLIIFPFFWYSQNARLQVPLFPPREQTFAAFFPLIGDFRGYWNRDRIFFFLWPLYVHSKQGTGKDFNEIHSFLWPIFGKYGGPEINGFRVWPLFSYVKKDNEYKRAFWLWPLGQYRSGRISKTNPRQQNVVFFLPFYAKFRQPNISLDLVFPFYGKLVVRDRVSQGYFLALYNRDINYRRGTREDRYLLFLIRKKTKLPNFTEEDVAKDAMLGGGVFPFYTRTHNDKKVRKNVIWPFSIYKLNRYPTYFYERKYFVPFYSSQLKQKTNGEFNYSKFVFPFFRERKTVGGVKRTNVLHLLFYNDVDAIDREYAPLWTVWEKQEDLKTGEVATRVFKNVSRYEKKADGSVRRELNLLLFNYQKTTHPAAPTEKKIKILGIRVI
ncbi:hypothetical protein BH09SUM1_BH09SUM1_25830 [soil metagenome]